MSTYWVWYPVPGDAPGRIATSDVEFTGWGIIYADNGGSTVYRPWGQVIKVENVTTLLTAVDATLEDLDAGSAAE